MADWRQIQARIRKAKAAVDAPAKLAELYERTRDAMVAFELAQFQEKAGEHAEAAKWYTSAAERFRRAQWRTKAEEALTRLGAPIPPPAAPMPITSVTKSLGETAEDAPVEAPLHVAVEGLVIDEEDDEADGETTVLLPAVEPAKFPGSAIAAEVAGPSSIKRRRRGRRGGRNRRKAAKPGEVATAQATETEGREVQALSSADPVPAVLPVAAPPRPQISHVAPARPAPSRPVPIRREPEPPVERVRSVEAATVQVPSWSGRTTSHAGEPALASRVAQLESQLRRMLSCPLASIDEADQAPAGPGVLLLSDSDQVTHYYIEACQTLRIGIGNLLRGGRGSKEGGQLKERMAENLGIADARVSKYLKDHCSVRWLQLDDGAPALAHFAVAVLRPVANE